MKRLLEILENDFIVLSGMFNSMNDLIFIMEFDGVSFRYVYINQAVCTLLNVENDIIGKRIEDVVYEKRISLLFKQYQKVLITKKPVTYIERIETKNGEFFGESKLSPILAADGHCKYVMTVVRDITERIQKERELKKSKKLIEKSREKYRIITRNAFDAIKLINPSGIIEYVSPANKKTLGYKSAEYVGKTLTHNIHPEDIPIVEGTFHNLMHEDESKLIEFRVYHKNGHYIWMEASMTPVIEAGKLKQIVTIERDITEKKRLREELEKAAYYDYLSGLPNRRSFHERLEIAIEQFNKNHKIIAVMLIDGRKFKLINDKYGHDAGDAVIKEMARRIEQIIRKTDMVARIGGDEMAIILPDLNCETEAKEIAKRILISFKEPLKYNSFEIKIGLSIGIAFYPNNSQDKRILLRLADEALYTAKQCNHDKYCIYSEE